MNIPWFDATTVTISVTGTGIAIGAWRTARRANRTAEHVARIETDRWQADLTPEFAITLTTAGANRATLDVQLTGPVPLQYLDVVHIQVVASDDQQRTDRTPGGPSQAELDRQVWGPYRFTPGADGADEYGRSVAPVSLRVGRGRPFAMETTRPPHWTRGDDSASRWRNQWIRSQVRLELVCRRDGVGSWVVPCRVDPPPVARVRSLTVRG